MTARRTQIEETHSGGGAPFRANPERSLQLAHAAARVAAENGATEIVILDMTGLTALFDYFVLATGTSSRQLRAIGDEIDQKLQVELNDRRMNLDGPDNSHWIVLDYGTIVVHLFDDETRQFYSLEALWADAPRLDLSEILRGV